MLFDYSKVRGRIREKFGTEGAFAEALGISRQALSRALSNRRGGLCCGTVYKWACLLDIPKSEFGEYFFCVSTLPR